VSGRCIARQAGISVFATGGLGGVHRGAELSFDVSADLTELGKTRVAVVSAGVKSILDIGKTLEVLETQVQPLSPTPSPAPPPLSLPSL
jgi:pseudouridine-5'-phosphate glycosidase